jgi:hypothetical protein
MRDAAWESLAASAHTIRGSAVTEEYGIQEEERTGRVGRPVKAFIRATVESSNIVSEWSVSR